jgi:hypothetical protein
MNPTNEIATLLAEAKRLAKRYKELTGRPLGLTGEIGEYESARLLGLEFAAVRTAGYDLIRALPGGEKQRLQVKARVLDSERSSGRLGSIDIEKEFDAVLLVMLNDDFDAFAIYEAPRDKVVMAIERPGSRSRNERHALGVQQFRAIAERIWPNRSD